MPVSVLLLTIPPTRSVIVSVRVAPLTVIASASNVPSTSTSPEISRSAITAVPVIVGAANIAVATCDKVALPSVPPSETNIWSLVDKVFDVKFVALSMFTMASTAPNSNALPPEFTFSTCPALPIDKDAPVPP